MLVGVFFISASILAFELICAQLLGFVLGTGFSLLVIGLAMLGIASAGSFFSGTSANSNSAELNTKLAMVCCGVAGAILVMFLFAALTKSSDQFCARSLHSSVPAAMGACVGFDNGNPLLSLCVQVAGNLLFAENGRSRVREF